MALETITEINLDINQPGVSIVHAKQYDTVRKVKCNLFNSGIKWLVPNEHYEAMVSYKKSDGIGGFYDVTELGETAVTVDSNDRSIIYIILDRNVVTTSGNVNTEITFYNTINNGRLSTFSFITQVETATITELDLSSNPYFNVLAEDIAAVLNAEANITGLTASANTLSAGSNATVSVSGGSGGNPYHLTFGIPRGSTGPSGSISQQKVYYIQQQNYSPQPAASSSSWSETIPTPSAGYYIWIKVWTKWNDNSEQNTIYCMKNGANGQGQVNTISAQGNTYNADNSYNIDLPMLPYTTVTTTDTDLDNYKTSGIYYFSSNYLPNNLPKMSVGGWLIVLAVSTTVVKQIFACQGTPGTDGHVMYSRLYSSSTWTSWARYWTDKEFTDEYSTYRSVESLGLNSGSAGIIETYQALPNNSRGLFHSGDFADSDIPHNTNQGGDRFKGIVEIVKTEDPEVSVIYFHGRGMQEHELKMPIQYDSSSETYLPSGEWWNILTERNFRSGITPKLTVAANSYYDYTVTLTNFNHAPTVFLTLSSDSSSGKVGLVTATVLYNTKAVNGFTIRVFNGDTTQRQPYVYWCAIDWGEP